MGGHYGSGARDAVPGKGTDMIFHDRYELLALRGGDDREIALPGREISSGRDVLVHLLSAGYTPENQELLAIIDRLTAEPRRRVLDKGDHEGIPYVVTEVLPPNLKLREWLAAAMSAAPPPTTTASPARSGVWRIPAVSEAPPKSAPAPDTPALEPGEFTRLFEAVKELEQVRRPPPTPDELPTASMPMPKLDPKVPAAPAEPGEFTRIMRSAAPPSPEKSGAGEVCVACWRMYISLLLFESCHYERSEESAFSIGGLAPNERVDSSRPEGRS